MATFEHTDLRTPLGPAVYMPYLQQKHPNGVVFYVQTAAGPQTVLAAIRQTIHQLDTTLVVDRLRTMEAQVDRSASDERALAFLAIGFGALAVLLGGGRPLRRAGVLHRAAHARDRSASGARCAAHQE